MLGPGASKKQELSFLSKNPNLSGEVVSKIPVLVEVSLQTLASKESGMF